MTLLILKLVCSHVVARFVLQPDLQAKLKATRGRSGITAALLTQSCLFMIFAALLTIPGYSSSPLALSSLLWLIAILGATRTVISLVELPPFPSSWQGFALAQILHVFAISAIASRFGEIPGLSKYLAGVCVSPRTYGLIIAYGVSLGLGGVVVPMITGLLRPEMPVGAKNAGKYIGVLERLLLTTLIIYWPTLDATAIGLIFSAKSVARFPEFKAQNFAEYYLLGTLTSFLIAIASGLLVRSYFPR